MGRPLPNRNAHRRRHLGAGRGDPERGGPLRRNGGQPLGHPRGVPHHRREGPIRSRTSDGTRVLPRSEWRLLDPDVMDWRIKAGDTVSLLHDLLKVRLVLEPGVVHTATRTASDEARARIRRAWEIKVHVYHTPDPDYAERRRRFISADLEFHRAFLAVVESDLLSQLFAVIEAALGLLLDLADVGARLYHPDDRDGGKPGASRRRLCRVRARGRRGGTVGDAAPDRARDPRRA